MILTLTIKQHGKKSKIIVTPLKIDSSPFEASLLDTLRGLMKAEQTLNSIPGSNLKVHISVEED
mgnify:FL=1